MAGLQGRVFAGYQLAAQIGSGGISEVYRGRPTAGGREVAVKVIFPEFAREPDVQARFRQCVVAAARIGSHPHVLPLLASGEENGYYYLVTPFVADGTLRDWLDRGGRLGVGDVAPFLQQLANGLAHAHGLGVVHGNLKPSNIFLFEGRHVLLGDFGMLWDITQLDMQHAGPGTEAVEFYAPEVFGGRVIPASDIYGMGAILFATLTGHAPFRGQTPGELFAAHTHKPVPPLAQFDPTLAPPLRALDPVIGRAMAKRPEERFPTAPTVAQATETTLQQAAGAAQTPGPSGWGVAAPNSRLGANWGPASQFPPGFGGFGATGGPSQYAGGMGGPAAPGGGMGPGGTPLQPLNFPPLPSSEEANGLMEEGRIAATWNDVSAQPTYRVPPPAAPLPPGPAGSPYGAPQQPGGPMGGMGPRGPSGPMPPAAPGVMPPAYPQAYPVGAPGAPGLPAAPGQPGMPAGVPPAVGTARPLTQLPEEAPREVKGYSATELGLPRLTALDLGGLPPELAKQLEAEMAGNPAGAAQNAGTGTGTGAQAAAPAGETGDGEEWDESRSYTAAGSRFDDESRESEAFSAAYAAPRSEWGYSEEMSAEMSARMTGRRPATRGSGRGDRDGRWDEGESVEVREARGRREGSSRRSSRRDDDDPRYDDRYDRRSSRGRRRDDDYDDEYDEEDEGGSPTWLRPAIIAAVVLLLVALGGVAVLKPEVCPISACASISAKVHKVFGGNAAAEPPAAPALTASPQQIQLSTTSATPVSAQLKLTNSGSASMNWQATSDLKWVVFTPANGTVAPGATATIAVQATPTGIAPGTYTSNVVITAGDTTVKVPLQVTVAAS